MSESNTQETELTEDHLDFLFRAGASPQLIEIVQKTGDNLPQTVGRNSAREEVLKYARWGSIGPDRDPEEFRPIGGHFFTALWNGDLYDAFTRADLNNRKILLLTFTERRINADRPAPFAPTVAQMEGRA